jgi:hypothetical protein
VWSGCCQNVTVMCGVDVVRMLGIMCGVDVVGMLGVMCEVDVVKMFSKLSIREECCSFSTTASPPVSISRHL